VTDAAYTAAATSWVERTHALLTRSQEKRDGDLAPDNGDAADAANSAADAAVLADTVMSAPDDGNNADADTVSAADTISAVNDTAENAADTANSVDTVSAPATATAPAAPPAAKKVKPMDPRREAAALVAEADKFAWGGDEVQPVLTLLGRLRKALAWAQEVGTATTNHGAGHAKPSLQRVRELVAEAEACATSGVKMDAELPEDVPGAPSAAPSITRSHHPLFGRCSIRAPTGRVTVPVACARSNCCRLSPPHPTRLLALITQPMQKFVLTRSDEYQMKHTMSQLPWA